ncbi:F0F1 ATP synthase subunit delta [Microbulbifer hydrolyticus]|uniref:ATP synthase subunit b n=1 Tax=Microbulbifer hydrolyticus TaxID=48074 RepID=A0A6P1TBU3_9GAMM|nr:F0F1 ATP synthase subunit delta [Microbulbifer hydrolyticus]MBB5210409.1 F-type H+-transporting ATPase subunit b [Microbulbifer hydrolyticus]QHQ39106.1 ATPase [Microbulbifer hydrolyticus]
MELNWTTFLLEIFNFLVLVWILKRFFYKPLQDAIARRQAAIEQRVDEARKMQESAQQLQQKYESDLAEIDREREAAREKLQREINDERRKREAALEESLQQQRQKAEAIAQQQNRERRRQQQQRALEQGSRFATRLLEEGAGPELEARLLELTLNGLRQLPPERLASLRGYQLEHPEPVDVVSAFPLPDAHREKVEQILSEILDGDIRSHFREDRTLMAGLRIAIGPWVLGVNVRDELKGFARLERETARE